MKRMVFLLLFLPSVGLGCKDHPTEMKSQPLWVQTLLKAAGADNHHHHPPILEKPKKMEDKKIETKNPKKKFTR